MGYARVKIFGVNIQKLYKLLKKNNIEMKNIERTDHKTIFFDVKVIKLKKLFAILSNSCYNISVQNYYGLMRYLDFFKKRLGYICGTIIFVTALCLSNLFVSDIKIYGTNSISIVEILIVLNNHGLSIGSIISKYNTEEIESILSKEFDTISLCSVIKKGTQIVVNIKEKQTLDYNFDVSQQDIVAKSNGTILSLDVIQGTSNFKVGDSFSAGDVLVSGVFSDIHGNLVECTAKANITAKIFYETTETFYETQEVFVKTGKKIKNSSFKIWGLEFLKTNSKNTFEFYETETKETYLFKNNFVPIKMLSTIIYETQKKTIEQSFDEQKANIIERLKNETHLLLSKLETIDDEYEIITKIDGGYNIKYVVEITEQI